MRFWNWFVSLFSRKPLVLHPDVSQSINTLSDYCMWRERLSYHAGLANGVEEALAGRLTQEEANKRYREAFLSEKEKEETP